MAAQSKIAQIAPAVCDKSLTSTPKAQLLLQCQERNLDVPATGAKGGVIAWDCIAAIWSDQYLEHHKIKIGAVRAGEINKYLACTIANNLTTMMSYISADLGITDHFQEKGPLAEAVLGALVVAKDMPTRFDAMPSTIISFKSAGGKTGSTPEPAITTTDGKTPEPVKPTAAAAAAEQQLKTCKHALQTYVTDHVKKQAVATETHKRIKNYLKMLLHSVEDSATVVTAKHIQELLDEFEKLRLQHKDIQKNTKTYVNTVAPMLD